MGILVEGEVNFGLGEYGISIMIRWKWCPHYAICTTGGLASGISKFKNIPFSIVKHRKT